MQWCVKASQTQRQDRPAVGRAACDWSTACGPPIPNTQDSINSFLRVDALLLWCDLSGNVKNI